MSLVYFLSATTVIAHMLNPTPHPSGTSMLLRSKHLLYGKALLMPNKTVCFPFSNAAADSGLTSLLLLNP